MCEILAKELNNIFNKNIISPSSLLIDQELIDENIEIIKNFSQIKQEKFANHMYILIIIKYRLYKVGFLHSKPIWDEETVDNLELCAGYGCKYAWYDLAQFYKVHPTLHSSAIDALEICLKFDINIAYNELVELHNYYKNKKNIKLCNQIKHILNKFMNKILFLSHS